MKHPAYVGDEVILLIRCINQGIAQIVLGYFRNSPLLGMQSLLIYRVSGLLALEHKARHYKNQHQIAINWKKEGSLYYLGIDRRKVMGGTHHHQTHPLLGLIF